MQAALASAPLVYSPNLLPTKSFLGCISVRAVGITNLQHRHWRISANHSSVNMLAAAPSSVGTAPKWAQKTVTLPAHRRGCHLVTSKILKEIGQDLSRFKCGLAHFFLQHTSASLTVNENYDSDVRDDTETFLNKVVPELIVLSPWQCMMVYATAGRWCSFVKLMVSGKVCTMETYHGRSR